MHNLNGTHLYTYNGRIYMWSLIARALSGKTRWVSSQVNFLFLTGEDSMLTYNIATPHIDIDFTYFRILFINDNTISINSLSFLNFISINFLDFILA